MILYDKKTLKEVEIYGVAKDKSGYPEVLIRDGNQWRYRSAKHYITTEECIVRQSDIRMSALDEIPESEKCRKCPMVVSCYGNELENPCEKCAEPCSKENRLFCGGGDRCLFELKL